MRRHDRVYLRAGASFSTPCAMSGSPDWQAAAAWIAAGRPLVAARQPADGGPVALGLTLPLNNDRKRLTIHVDRSAIAEIRPPLPVRSCLAQLPAADALALQALDAEIAACGAQLGVFGSLAWESVSREAYRRAESDIDIVCDVADRGQYAAALAALARAADRLDCRLDGELRFPGGYAVAWRELAAADPAGGQPVLAKGERDVALLALNQLLAGLAA